MRHVISDIQLILSSGLLAINVHRQKQNQSRCAYDESMSQLYKKLCQNTLSCLVLISEPLYFVLNTKTSSLATQRDLPVLNSKRFSLMMCQEKLHIHSSIGSTGFSQTHTEGKRHGHQNMPTHFLLHNIRQNVNLS